MSVPPPIPPSVPCANCGMPWPGDSEFCPNCGYIRLAVPVWPPAPVLEMPAVLRRPKLLTGRVWGDFLLGAAVQYLTHLITARVLIQFMPAPASSDPQHWNEAIGALLIAIGNGFFALAFGLLIYFVGRRYFPIAARGSGYATLTIIAALLGAFFTCHVIRY